MQSTSRDTHRHASMAQSQQDTAPPGTHAADPRLGGSWTIEITKIAVEGLPKPLIGLSHKCYAKLTVGDQKRMTSKVERSLGGTEWQEKYTFTVAPSSALEIRIYNKGTIARKYDFVGGIQEKVDALCGQGDEKAMTRDLEALGASSKIQVRITFRIVSRPSDQSPDMLRLDDLVHQANQGLDHSDQPPPILESAEQAVSYVNNTTEPLRRMGADLVSSAAGALKTVDTNLKSLLDRFEIFVKVVDKLAEVHPYAKVAWSVLSFAYKVALSQKLRDEAIQNLAVTMGDMYAFLCEAEQLKRFESQAKILTVILKQTEECAYFIQGYAQTKSFFTRAVKHLFTSVDDKVKSYQDKFAQLKEAFQGNAILQTEIVVTRMMDLVSHASASIELNDIPYASGARFSVTTPCLAGTREGILERIQLLLSGVEDDQNTRIVLLTGVVGDGKSAIARTIAERFEERGRLTSSFFFNRNDPNRNRVDNVFCTVARDIADRNPEIKDRLWAIIKDNRSLRTTTDASEQFIQFILTPAEQVTTVGPAVIVFDGVDQCGNPQTRVPFLDLLAKFSQLPPTFRMLITARPENDIVESVACLPFVKHIVLEDVDRQSTEADLSTFVSNELFKVKMELEKKWPNMRWRDELVRKADGLFIWVSTACRFVKNEGKAGTDCCERLKQILSHKPNAASPESLDNLYLTVLRATFDETDTLAMARFKAVIGKVLMAEEPLSRIALSGLLEADDPGSDKDGRDVVESVIPYLGSVLIGTTQPDLPVEVLHLSFKEFLTNASSSGPFFIDIKEQTINTGPRTEYGGSFNGSTKNHNIRDDLTSMSMLNNGRDFYAPNSIITNVGGGTYNNQYNGPYSEFTGTFNGSTINQNIGGPTSNYNVNNQWRDS